MPSRRPDNIVCVIPPVRRLVVVGIVAALASSCTSEPSAPAVLQSESTPSSASDAPPDTEPVDVSTSVASSDPSPTPSGSVTTIGPATTVDHAVVEDAVAQWGAICADVVAGLAAMPSDVSASMGELAKVLNDLSVGAGAVPATGLPDDPTEDVRAGLTASAASITDAALSFAGGDEAAAGAKIAEAVAQVELIVTRLRDFGADC